MPLLMLDLAIYLKFLWREFGDCLLFYFQASYVFGKLIGNFCCLFTRRRHLDWIPVCPRWGWVWL